MSVLAADVVIVAYPVRNGDQVLMPRRIERRSCFRLDGYPKAGYASRADARHGCPKHETIYRCRYCSAWHRATKSPTACRRERARPAAWVQRHVA